VIDSGEECDDSNTESLDGCSKFCEKEEMLFSSISSSEDLPQFRPSAGPPPACVECQRCGEGFFNLCDAMECLQDRGINRFCAFSPWKIFGVTLPFGTCMPNVLQCGRQ